jgi:hypothetical protein
VNRYGITSTSSFIFLSSVYSLVPVSDFQVFGAGSSGSRFMVAIGMYVFVRRFWYSVISVGIFIFYLVIKW